jgi:hypothetical protein
LRQNVTNIGKSPVEKYVPRFSVPCVSQSDPSERVKRTLKVLFVTSRFYVQRPCHGTPFGDTAGRAPKLQAERRAQKAGWKHDCCGDQGKHAMNRDPENAEWYQNQPDKWIRYQCQKCDRPTDHKQKAPGQKCKHGTPPVHLQCKLRRSWLKSSRDHC